MIKKKKFLLSTYLKRYLKYRKEYTKKVIYMKDYYEILVLTPKASKEDIKRAYFGLVRKYPPDRFEVEFMNIRQAYETLSNEETRKQYDSINNLSSGIKEDYRLARTLMEEGNLNKAIKILEKIQKENSKMLLVKASLAEAYLDNNNSGKAVKIYEELTAIEPNNAAFAGYLANAYLNRGWHKKAISAYNTAIQLDSDNISLWLGLSSAHVENWDYWNARTVLEKSLEVVKNIEGNTTIYLELIMLDINFKMFSTIHKSLDKLVQLSINNDEVKDNVAFTLAHLADYLMQRNRQEDAITTIQKAAQILPDNKEITKIKKEIENFVKCIDEFHKMEKDKKIRYELTALISLEVIPSKQLEMNDETEKVAMTHLQEYCMLNDYNKYRISIKKLKSEYPNLYDLKAEFLNKLTDSTERKKLQIVYEKQVGKYKSIIDRYAHAHGYEEDDDYDYDEEDDDAYDYEPPQEPIVRDEPKVGRNDPCPCGSGKKYKKCCGK